VGEKRKRELSGAGTPSPEAAPGLDEDVAELAQLELRRRQRGELLDTGRQVRVDPSQGLVVNIRADAGGIERHQVGVVNCARGAAILSTYKVTEAGPGLPRRRGAG
jgi:hypothetical protein